jgi:hypothetical protein
MNFKTHVNPSNLVITPVAQASNIFFNELCIPLGMLRDGSVLKIVTSGKYDVIKIDERHLFSKRKFITSKSFKHRIEEYYNALNFYVEKPIRIADDTGTREVWFIKLKASRKV